MSKNNKLQDRLAGLQHEKEGLKGNSGKVISGIISQEQETPDFAKIAEELQQRHAQEKRSLNDEHVKMTIYVEANIANAFNALCVKRGDQKEYINAALADYIQKRYKELQAEKPQKNN